MNELNNTGAKGWIRQNMYLLIILAVASFLRLYHIDYQSVWLDEIHTLIECKPGVTLAELYESLKVIDPHPPLYFILVKISFALFGYTTVTMRVVTAIIGIAGVAAIYALGKELYNKRVGLYAAAIITVSYFHIHYSQDARPYVLLFFTTVLSFLFLAKFIKQPTYAKAALYGLFAGLMIYSHFFSLFALLAQAFILLYFIFRPLNTSRGTFFKQCLVAGLIIIVLYIPCYPLLMAASGRTSIWIAKPTFADYLDIYKDFFGYSKTLIYGSLALIIYYLALPYIKKGRFLANDHDKYRLSILLLLPWIIITILIPAIRSHISLPMIVNRYFINIYPAFILAVCIGIYHIKNKFVRNGILGLLLIVCLNNLIRKKEYYNAVTKTQFREVTDFIIAKNQVKAPIVTTLDWHYKYFFTHLPQQQIIFGTPDNYISKMRAGTARLMPFWLTDAHGTKLAINQENMKYLQEHFILQEDAPLFDAWAQLYVPKSMNQLSSETMQKAKDKPFMVLQLDKFSPGSEQNNGGLEFYSTGSKKSPKIGLKKGKYKIQFQGISYPAEPINDENAHFTVKVNGIVAGDFYLDEKGRRTGDIDLNLQNDSDIVIEIMFDNDLMESNKDRNGTITAIEIFETK